MNSYRVRYLVYRIRANSLDEAHAKVCKLYASNAKQWIKVEPDSPKRGVLGMLFFGTK